MIAMMRRLEINPSHPVVHDFGSEPSFSQPECLHMQVQNILTLSLIPYPTVNPHPKACWNSSIQRRGIRRSRNKNKEEMEELETQLKQKKKRCRLVGQCQLHRLMFAPKTIISPKFKCQDFEKYDRKGVCTLISSFMVLLWPNMAMTTSCWFKHSQEVSLE